MADTTAVGHHYVPEVVLPPGGTLAEVLEERGIAPAEFAERTGLSVEHVNLMIGGQTPVTTEIAELLELETGVSAEAWANLEAAFRAYETRIGEKTSADQGLVAGAADGR